MAESLATRERRRARAALKGYARLRAEMDRRWDADRARYGMDMPQYGKPDSFPKGKWELWCDEHPGAINVVAWRQALGVEAPPPPPAELEPEPEHEPSARAEQLSFF